MDALKDLINYIIPRTYKKNDIIVKEKEKSNGYMFFVFNGKLGIYKTNRGSESFLGNIDQFSFFGEISLILNRDRDATIRVDSEAAKLGLINQKIFFELANKKPQFMIVFLKTSIKRVIDAQNRLDYYLSGRKTNDLFDKEINLTYDKNNLKLNIFEFVHQFPQKTYKKNDIIFEEKVMPDGNMYFIIEGNIDLYRVINGELKIIRHLEAGDYFGEMALLLKSHPRAASARVSSPFAKLVSINEGLFMKIGDINPQFYMTILKTIYLRLLDIERRIDLIIGR
ncbi:MAG TPA: cyclic nucleotide-binding domain-containing protein [Spirochaetota bacterium]|nr:cyclic nucleotide-binding domain-containing protein [Spirochaetota bacterium]